MKNVGLLFTVIVILTTNACAKLFSHKVSLQWNIAENKEVRYSNYFTAGLPEKNNGFAYGYKKKDDIHSLGFELFEDKQKYLQVFKSITAIESPESSAETSISRNNNNFRALTKIVDTDSQIQSHQDRKTNKHFLGHIRSSLDFTQSGKNLSTYLTRRSKNISAMYFLPKQSVSVGDSWVVPGNLLGAGEGFIPSKYRKKSEASLVKVWDNTNGDRIARIQYVIAENFIGHHEQQRINRLIKLSAGATLVGYIDFFVDRGYTYRSLMALMYISVTDGKIMTGNTFVDEKFLSERIR